MTEHPSGDAPAAGTTRGVGNRNNTDSTDRSVTQCHGQPRTSAVAGEFLNANKACASCGKPFSSARRPSGIVVYQTETATDAFRSIYIVCRKCKREARRRGGLEMLPRDHELALELVRTEPLGDVQ